VHDLQERSDGVR